MHTPEEIDEASLILKLIGTIWKTRRRGSEGWRPGIKGRARWMSACQNTGAGVPEYGCGSGERKRCVANLARLCTVKNLPLHIGSRPGFLEVHEEVGAPMAKHIKTKRDEVSERSK